MSRGAKMFIERYEQDEPPPFGECTECGEAFPTDVMICNMCPPCHSDYVDQENLELAQETFGKAVINKMEGNSRRSFYMFNILVEWIIRNASEDDLHILAEKIDNFKIPKEGGDL